jgi:hypothetical protein
MTRTGIMTQSLDRTLDIVTVRRRGDKDNITHWRCNVTSSGISLLALIGALLSVVGCADVSYQSGSGMGPRQPASSSVLPGAIPPGQLPSTLPGAGPGYGLTKVN